MSEDSAENSVTSIETVVNAITGMLNEGGGEELELSWELELGGNCLAGTLDAGEEAVVAIVTYTVRSLETS